MKNASYDYGYGTDWKDVYVYRREGYYTSVADFHEHDFYEVNLILSGNVKILLKNGVEEGIGSRIVLTGPGTPHFVSCHPDALYSRLYLDFSEAFIASSASEWMQISKVFGENGRIVNLTEEQTSLCGELIERIGKEKKPFRQRILILYLLSWIEEFVGEDTEGSKAIPKYIMEALGYIRDHYAEKVTAERLAAELHICRTTLMTGFKKYTGTTLCDYILHFRLKNVIQQLKAGKTEQEAAEASGFGDSSGLIRCFKKRYGMTPRQYLVEKNIKR